MFQRQTIWNIRDREKPLLTWNAPIGLGLEETSGKIIVRGDGHNFAFTPERVPVPINDSPPKNTEISASNKIFLLGNGVEFDGGILRTSAERVEIGSVGKGQVRFLLPSESEFDYSPVENFSNISLNSFSFIDLNANRATEISLRGNSIELKNGSLISSQRILGETFIKPDTININAKEQLLVRGVITSTPPSSEGLSRGITLIDSQNINIITKNLILESGGQIESFTFPGSSGKGINIEASELVRVSGFVPNNSVLGFSVIASSGSIASNSNPIAIDTKNLAVTNGGVIGSSTIDGISGDVSIEAESILVEGFSTNNATTLPSQIASVAFGSGTGGNIDIKTTNLSILNAGNISTASFSNATAGNININASDYVIIDGFTEQDILNNVDGFSTINSLVSQFDPRIIDANPILPDTPLPTGNAGNVSLTTNNLTISDRASITVQNDGTGNAGSININANSINLDTEGSINGAALSGEGGNISVTSDRAILNNSFISASSNEREGGNIKINSDRLTLNSSIISASANEEGGNISVNASDLDVSDSQIEAESLSQQGGNITVKGDRTLFQDSNLSASAAKEGDGGNITIDADTVLGINSDITATAVEGNGGNILINSNGVLGFTERPATNNDGASDVDASSQFGTDGTVTITNPQNTISDPLILLVTAPPRDEKILSTGDCYNEAGEPLLTDNTHDNVPDSPRTYLDNDDISTSKPVEESLQSPSDDVIEKLLWKPGQPYAEAIADTQIQTPDGRIFAVNRKQLMQMQQQGCLQLHEIEE